MAFFGSVKNDAWHDIEFGKFCVFTCGKSQPSSLETVQMKIARVQLRACPFSVLSMCL